VTAPRSISTGLECRKCGAALPEDAPHRLCPSCLLAAALGSEGSAPEAPAGPAEARAVDEPHDRISCYKLLQKLGEGGCGVVYMAEQTEPVRRRVALKVIKLGMDTRQVIARFEAERQALAMMDHPNIAKVLDAGATRTGRPYFVMELVKGIRITDYCDQNHLSTRERLNLFVQVCQAIQHAHQKGIIHRDIKPSNILVTLHDGVPVPKVIDFGIAKATEQPLTDKTVFTAFGQFMGTPAYMSPEMAELSGLDIDTRSDIYALGVLLYELLTGRTPFDAKELLQGGLDEMRRRIREVEPLRPSTRLSTMANADLTVVAQCRQSEPGKLSRFLRGDLDWIVMKCLEKDRRRRYETANGVAMDIQRYVQNEPVLACPPSAVYRFQKMVRRNKVAVTAVLGVAATLVLGLGLSTWLWLSEREAHQRARMAEALMGDVLNRFIAGQITRTAVPPERREVWMGQTNKIPQLVPPGDSARLFGRSYAQWAAAWWKWALEMPPTNSAGAVHPWIDSPSFDVTASQTSNVWFLGAPFLEPGSTNSVVRRCEIPAGKSLFFPLFSVESSSIEAPPFYGETAEAQAKLAQSWTDLIVGPFCQLDGVPLMNLDAYSVQSPQISIEVPAPWILGKSGGKGTSCGSGYFVFLAPLPPGRHTLRLGATMVLTKGKDPTPLDQKWVIDTTYQITVTGAPP
jgi:serine/threonine protein kinase